jgi:hypothetical protein
LGHLVCNPPSFKRGGKKTYNHMVACYFLDTAKVWRALRRVCASPSEVCLVIDEI